jgi:hypothetical protein
MSHALQALIWLLITIGAIIFIGFTIAADAWRRP